MKKLIIPVLISIIALTSCSKALYKNKYDWVKVDRQPATVVAKSESKPIADTLPVALVANPAVDIDSVPVALETTTGNDETPHVDSDQSRLHPAQELPFVNEERVVNSVAKIGTVTKSGFSKLKFRNRSIEKNGWQNVWKFTRIVLMLAAIGFVIWAIAGLEGVLIGLAIGLGILIGIAIVIWLIVDFIFEILGEIFS